MRAAALICAALLLLPQARAQDFSRPMVKLELGLRFDHRGRLETSLNGIPLGGDSAPARMTCAEPPEGCRTVVLVMLGATVLGVAALVALEKNRKD